MSAILRNLFGVLASVGMASVVSAAMCFAAAANASIVAEFADGNGTASPDQYLGSAGDGWLTPWRTVDVNHGGLTWTNAVTSANPLAGAGGYLSGQAEAGPGFFVDGAVQRQYGEGGSTGIAYAAEHTINWRFRVDEAANFNPKGTAAFGDGIRFDDRADVALFNSDLPTWIIEATSIATGGVPQWTFGDFFNFDAWVITPTNVNFVVGDVFEFTVHRDNLAAGTWDGTVTNLDWDPADGGLATFTLNDMNAGGFDVIPTSGGFTMIVGMGDIDTFEPPLGRTLDFSLDSLHIVGPAAIPEAHTLLIWSGLALGAVVAQWWRNRSATNQ
jgi:hypothetical protein